MENRRTTRLKAIRAVKKAINIEKQILAKYELILKALQNEGLESTSEDI